MDENQNNKYELIDGYAVVDNNFEIITANEALYKFIGISIKYTIMNVIHQVDIDDFIDVAGSLKINQKKSMVLRMRRVDNSFRWVLVEITRKEITGSKDDEEMEYLELNISDIASLKNQNKALDNTITRDYTADYAVELVAYAFTFEPYGAVAVLEKNKTLRKALASSLLNERYIENKMLMLDRFDGVILSTKMDEFTKEKFLDNYKSLANYFYNIKTRSHDYLNYLENN